MAWCNKFRSLNSHLRQRRNNNPNTMPRHKALNPLLNGIPTKSTGHRCTSELQHHEVCARHGCTEKFCRVLQTGPIHHADCSLLAGAMGRKNNKSNNVCPGRCCSALLVVHAVGVWAHSWQGSRGGQPDRRAPLGALLCAQCTGVPSKGNVDRVYIALVNYSHLLNLPPVPGAAEVQGAGAGVPEDREGGHAAAATAVHQQQHPQLRSPRP